MDSAMGTLCQYCKFLEIDDAAWGGFRDESIPGKNVLAFSGGTVTDGKRFYKYEAGVQYRQFTCHYGRQDTYPYFPSLKESAPACGFCALLRNWIRWRMDPDDEYEFRPYWSALTVSFRSLTYIWREAISNDGTYSRMIYALMVEVFIEGNDRPLFGWIEIRAPGGPCATWLSIPREPPELPGLWGKISMIASKISKCSEHCGHRRFSDSVPSRLIYVGDETEYGFGDPRLVVMSDSEHLLDGCMKDDIKYAALSYCWGKSVSSVLMTTTDNFAAHLKKIPLARMPATCRDAILVTRALGLKWLWIDAFCIIQGKKADWHKEAFEMASIYGNAFITIIPLRSRSSHDGFLDRMKEAPEAMIPFKSSIYPTIEGYYTLSVPCQAHVLLQRELIASRWLMRGWTFQENTMSLRKLYFGKTDVYFRCASQWTSNYESTILEPRALEGEFWSVAKQIPTRISANSRQNWYNSLGDYSRRELTFDTDAFPAISAIARMYCNGREEEFQCGLWRSDLHIGVLWILGLRRLSREEHMKKLASQDGYTAPSWSWAVAFVVNDSAEYTFSMPDSYSPIWEILETESILADASNPFGPVLSGHILVKGAWCALSDLTHTYLGRSRDCLIFSDGNVLFDWTISKDVDKWEREKQIPESYTEGLVILLTAETVATETFWGLLLAPSAGDKTWYRVGLFFADPDMNKPEDGIFRDWRNRGWKEGTFKII